MRSVEQEFEAYALTKSMSGKLFPNRPISELDEWYKNMEPRDITYGPADPDPVPICAACKSDNVRYDGGNVGWCFECSDNREMEEEK